MEVNIALDITPEEFFDSIANSLEYDIKESTGKRVKFANLKKGYNYTKKLKSKMGGNATVKVTIEELEYPVVYAAKFDSASGINKIRYEIEKLDDCQIGLSYTEEFEGAKRSYNINGAIFEWLLSIPNKKSLRKKFREMESVIIENRGKTPEQIRAEIEDMYEDDED
jgi:hypothetical protein